MTKRASGPDSRPASGSGSAGSRPASRAAELPEPGLRSTLVLLVVAILLFAMMLRGEHILVRAAGDPAVAAIQVATFLSSILFAGLMLGNAAGLAAVRAFAGHDGTALLGRAARRTVLAVLGGLVAGVVSGGAAYLLEADLHSGDRLLVGTSIAISALLGGAAAALRPGLMVAAGVLGTLVVLAVLALRSVFITPLTRLFGGEGTIQKYASAQSTLALVSFVVAGVVAGVAIHLYARRTGNRLRIASTIGAGATAGVFTLVGLALTWVFDRQLISSAGGLDLGDQLAFHIAGMYQLNGGLALLFAGAIVALLLYGRTRGPRRPRRPKRPTSKPEWAVREERRAAELDRTARADSATGKTSTGNKSSAGRSATGRTGTGKAATGKSATAGKTTTTDKTSASGKGSAGDKNPASDKTATSGKGSAGGKNPTSGKAATSDKSSAGGKAGAGANSSAGGNGAGGNGAGGKGAAGRKPGGNKSSGAKTAGATAPGGKTAGGTESGGTESGGTASGGTAGTAEAEGAAGAEATDTGNASTGSTAQPAGNRRRART